MIRRQSAVRAWSIGLVAAALLASCDAKQATTKPTPTTSARGGTLHVAVRDLSSLDPARSTGRGATFVLAQIFRSLTTVDGAGDPKPAAATGWSVTADGLRWDFRIAAAKFHDGTAVTAAAFKNAFDRLALKSTASDIAYQLEPVRGFHDVKVAGTAKVLSGVVVRDSATLVIFLTRPFAELPRFLAHPALGPVPAAISRPSFESIPIGNGPFKVEAARTPTSVNLVPFTGFTGTKPIVERVQVGARTNGENIWSGLLNGGIDVGEVPPNRAKDAEKEFGPNVLTPFWAAFYYGLNTRLAKYKDARVRRAISQLIDREALVPTVYGGAKVAATGLLPEGIPGARSSACDACKHNVDAAKATLRAIFKSKLPALTIDHLDASPSGEVAAAIAEQLREAGFTVTLRKHTSAQYKALLASGKQDIAELGWFSDVPSPDPFLAQQLRTGSANNPLGFSDKAFDKALDTARATKDGAKRVAAYGAAQDRALALMPLIPIVFFRSRIVARSNVQGLRLDGAGIFDASTVYFSS